jgi:hypothetical protein
MSKKAGQARILSISEQAFLFDVLQQHRHPTKNTAIMQISFKLGLRAQEISLLEFKEVCHLKPFRKGKSREFTLFENMALPAAYTKGADAMNRSKSKYERTSLTFKRAEFDRVLRQVEKMAKSNVSITPSDYYPIIRENKGKSRTLSLKHQELREALEAHIVERLDRCPTLLPSDHLFVSQKGGSYSPNTLQEHMALMLRDWAGVEKASSHSGRRTVIDDIIHKQKKSVRIAQKIAGHKDPSTTLIYTDATDEEQEETLLNLGKSRVK